MAKNSKESIEHIVQDGIDRMLAEAYRDKQTDGPWYKVGDTHGEKELTAEDRKLLLQNSRDRYWKTAEGRCLIESAVHYTIGKGIVYHADDENPVVQEKLDEFWKHPANMMELRQKEVVRRSFRDGEVFIRFFEGLDGVTYLRFVEPEQIVEIITDPNDAETPTMYRRKWVPANEHTERVEDIPADDMVHIKLHVDLNMRRGRPYIEPSIKRLIQLEQFIEGRVRKNRIAAGHILEKIVKGSAGTAAAVSSVGAGMTDADKDTGTGTAAKKMPKIGSVVVHNEAIEYKWCEPKINADDCKEDARLIKLSVCASVNAPEFLLSDASNANYASTLVAENPYVRSIEDYQDTFEVYLQTIFRKVIQRLINKGAIPGTSTETVIKERWFMRFVPQGKLHTAIREALGDQEQTRSIPTKTSVSIEFPQMVHKELKADTEAYQIHSSMGWADDSTLAGKLGYDYEKERAKTLKRKKEEGDTEDEHYEQGREDELNKDGKEEGKDE